MSVREQKLEEALAEAQSSISVEPHPLLVRDSQIRMASPVPGLQRAAKAGVVDAPQAPDNGIGEVVASLGMMSLNEKSYHGETVASEVCNGLHILSMFSNRDFRYSTFRYTCVLSGLAETSLTSLVNIGA